MKILFELFEKAVIRRVSVWIAGIVIGWASNHWLVQSCLAGLDLDVNDQQGIAVAIAAVLALVLGAAVEIFAAVRRRAQEGKAVTLEALIEAAHQSGELSALMEKSEPALRNVAAKVLADIQRKRANQVTSSPAPAKVVPILLAALAGAAVLTACSAPSNRTAYQAAGVVKVTAESAMEGWAAWARAGKAAADEIRAVEKAYRAYVLAQNLVVDAGKATVGSADKTKLQVALQVAAACEADVVALVVKFLPPDLAAKLKGL